MHAILTCIAGVDALGEPSHDLVLHDGVAQVEREEQGNKLPHSRRLALKTRSHERFKISR